MVNLEIPWINFMSKMDLVTTNVEDQGSGRNGIRSRKDISRYSIAVYGGVHGRLTLCRYLDPDPLLLASAPSSREEKTERNSKFHSLNRAIVQLVRIRTIPYGISA